MTVLMYEKVFVRKDVGDVLITIFNQYGTIYTQICPIVDGVPQKNNVLKEFTAEPGELSYHIAFAEAAARKV